MTENPPHKRHWLLWIAISTVVALIAATLGFFWLKRSGREFSTTALTNLIESSFNRVAGDRFALSIDSLTVDFRTREINGYGVDIEAKPEPDVEKLHSLLVQLPHLKLTEAKPLDLLRGRLPTTGGLIVNHPVLRLGYLQPDSNRASTNPADLVARMLHGLQLDSLLLNDLTVVRNAYFSLLPDTLVGIRLSFTGVQFDSTTWEKNWSSLFSDNVSLFVPQHSWETTSGQYEVTSGPLAYTTAQAAARLDTLSLGPVASDAQLIRQRGHRGGRYLLDVGPVNLRGFQADRLLEDGDLFIESVDVNGFSIDYYEDARPPPGPKRKKWQPQRWAAGLDRKFDVDTLRLTRGKVLYERFAGDGTRKGSLPFRGMYATGYHLNNLPSTDDGRPVSQLDVLTRIAGTGELAVHFELDLAAPDFDMRYTGRFGPMALEPLNNFLIPTEGLRIRSGHVDRASFNVRVNNGVAAGTFDARYNDLNIVEVNKASGRSRIRHRIRSFLLNRTRLKSSNLESDRRGLRQGIISHTYSDTETFLHFLWFSTRSGIFSITGMEN